jgi:phosphatidylinositol alpha-1,6-mannosyltransferase
MQKSTLFLTLETFSQTGGIQKMCRALAKALQETTGNLTLYSLCDTNEDLMDKYVSKDHFAGFNGSKPIFTFTAILACFKHRTVVLAHINLLPIAYLIKFCLPSRRVIMLAHGIEVWKKLSRLQRRFLNKHTEIWAVSGFTKSKLTEDNDINPANIKVLHNCLDPFFSVPLSMVKPLSLMRRYKITAGQPVLLTISRLSKFELMKGYDLIIKCLPSLLIDYPTLKYMIVGPCEKLEKQRLEQLIDKLNLCQQVILGGSIAEDELSEHFLLADVFILPSQKEGFGLVLIEAAACGCKVIAGNRDGSTEALLGGKLGTLVDPESPDHIVAALKFALKNTCAANSLKNQTLALNSFGYSVYRNNVKMLLS